MKFFIISDVHSFYTPMIKALNEAGFEQDNPNHWLISCGDNFDRGDESEKVRQFLLNLPQKTLIKGNHEDLILDCCERGYPEWHDDSNGTMKTIIELGHAQKYGFDLACSLTYTKLEPLFNQMVNYFETKNYVFVHSFIPYFTITGEWRKAVNAEWKEARWENPFVLCKKGLWKENKKLVFGHWHTSKEWSKLMNTPEHGEGAIYDIYETDSYIGLDACTVLSKKVNVLVMEDEFLNA